MRLTLRTLLAYLDDILEPADARDMGAKIAESPRASELVRRIRDVMRRRRLTAPDLDGPGAGLDPNTVAEYLDNTLPPEHVGEVERICLESDVHLAEVAASHQILTLVLGEPVEVIPESRERMYALGPVSATSDQVGKFVAPETAVAAAAAATAQAASNGSAAARHVPAQPFADRIPDYLRPTPLWKRALPIAAVAVLLAAFVGLLATDPAFNPFSRQPETNDETAAADVNDEKAAAAPARSSPRAEEADQTAGDAAVVAAAGNANAAIVEEPALPAVVNLDPPPPADDADSPSVVDARPPAIGTAAATTGETTAVAAAETRPQPAPAEQVQPNTPSAEAPEAAPKGPPIEYGSAEGVFLRHDEGSGDWFMLPRRSLVHVGERVASPEPYDAVLNIGRTGLVATLQGGTSARLLPPAAAGEVGLEVERGRVVFERRLAGDGTNPALTVRVGNETWRLELLSDEARCGVEIVPGQPHGFEEPLGENAYVGGLYVALGTVAFTDQAGQRIEINGRDWISLTPTDRAATVAGTQPTPPLLTVPTWLESLPKTSSQRRFGTQFERVFEFDQPMTLSVMALIKDPLPQLAELAVKCFAVTSSYGPLVKALDQSPHEEGRVAAIEGLRTWLPTDVENGVRLKNELANTFQPDDALLIYQLLWGYDADDARDANVSAQLVDWLEHDQDAIRELAIYHILRLTQRRYDYRAQMPAAQRQLAVNRWRSHLEREGALLPPAP